LALVTGGDCPENRNRVRDDLIIQFLPLVRRIATRMCLNMPPDVECDDLINSGVLGLISAASRYEPAQHANFSTFAKYRIRGAILDGLRDEDRVSRRMRTWWKRYEKFSSDFSGAHGCLPTDDEIARGLGVKPAHWREIAREIAVVSRTSARLRPFGSSDGAGREIPARADCDPAGLAIQSQVRKSLAKAMGRLSPRHRLVVDLYYDAELTLREIGERLGVRESRVCQIHREALDRMAIGLARQGIQSGGAIL
jgi:RNA polymerase sigma factor for flagellar operon FliA